MKIVYKKELKDLAKRLGEVLGVRSQISDDSSQIGDETVFVGSGLVNEALKDMKKYSKCWEIGSKADSFDYLDKIIFNKETVESNEPERKRRKSPEHIIPQEGEFDCGKGAVSTLFLMKQMFDVLKTDLYSRLEVNPVDGTKSINIKKLLDEENVPFLEVWNADLVDVENILKYNGVMLVSYQAWGEPDEVERMECGHYSIIFDVDDEFVWLIDPSIDEEYTPGFGRGVVRRSREEFEKLWIDKGVDGTIYDKWLLAVRI
jgi:hypothetical protein